MAQLSARGAHFIGRFEGWRDKPYNDPTGNATIGFGHLIHMGPVTAHDKAEWGTITMQRGIQLLQHDAGVAITAIGHYIARPLSQCQVDALASFAYNCGGGALAGLVGHAVNAHQDRLRRFCNRTTRGTSFSPACTSGESVKRICSRPATTATVSHRRTTAARLRRSPSRSPRFRRRCPTGRGSGSSGSWGTRSSRDAPATRRCATSRKRPPPSRRGCGNS